MDGWKSASERPIWSAFNGLEGKAREEGIPFFLLLGRVLFLELSFWNSPRSRFFWFPVTVFIVHELFLWDMQAAPATIVLSQLDLFDISQTKWRILTVRYKQWISERLRVGFRGEMAVQGGLILRSFLLYFCSVLALFFFPERCILLPSGRCWECLWSSRGAFPLPCLPKNAFPHLW